MQDRKRLLVLTPRFPYPIIGGDRLRIYYMCKELSKDFEITLLSLCETHEELHMQIPDDGVFTNVERVYLPKWRSYLNCLLSLPTNIPLQVAYYSSKVFKKKVEKFTLQHELALAHLIRTGHYLRGTEIPKVLEMTDAISMNYERVGSIAKASDFKSLVYSVEQKRLKSYEQAIASDFSLSVLVSNVDKSYLFPEGSDAREKVLVCSNGVDFSTLPCGYKPDGKTIIFIGNMTTLQNVDAARWFAKTVMPELVKLGDYQFRIIGRIKTSVQEEFNRYINTVATGAVDSVAEAASGATVGVCPMRLGAGVQNKVLEYMALGLPAITSSVGLEGIEAKIGSEILVADSVSEYVELISDIVNNPDKAKKIGLKGNNYVFDAHTWEGKLSPLVKRVTTLVKQVC